MLLPSRIHHRRARHRISDAHLRSRGCGTGFRGRLLRYPRHSRFLDPSESASPVHWAHHEHVRHRSRDRTFPRWCLDGSSLLAMVSNYTQRIRNRANWNNGEGAFGYVDLYIMGRNSRDAEDNRSIFP